MTRFSLFLGVAFSVCCGFAEVFTWTGSVDGIWTNAANWTVNGEPAARKPVTLITYTDAAPAVLPDVTIEGIPESEAARWATDFYGRELRVKYIRGMVLNFR